MADISSNGQDIKRCSRCRSRRDGEEATGLKKYATCTNCRSKRKIVKRSVEFVVVDNVVTFNNFNRYLNALKINQVENVTGCKFLKVTDPKEFSRYDLTYINSLNMADLNALYSSFSKKLIDDYIGPISLVTGYRFPIRDHHRGGSKSKKITMMFVCSQDKTRQRRSRSKEKRNVANKLKIFNCFSKIGLLYDILTGELIISFDHNTHEHGGEHAVVQGDETLRHIDLSIQSIAAAASVSNADVKKLLSTPDNCPRQNGDSSLVLS